MSAIAATKDAVVHEDERGIGGKGAGDYRRSSLRHDYKSVPSRKRRIVERTCAACAVFIEYAPPASTFLHALHFQIPTAVRFTESFPQKRHVKRECWETSIFFTCLRSDEPYRTPYLPVIPTFLVLFCVCAARGRGSASGSARC